MECSVGIATPKRQHLPLIREIVLDGVVDQHPAKSIWFHRSPRGIHVKEFPPGEPMNTGRGFPRPGCWYGHPD